MRKYVLLATSVLLAACGSGGGDSTCSPETDFACAFQPPSYFGGSGPIGFGGSGGNGGTMSEGGSGGAGGTGGGGTIGDDPRCAVPVGVTRREAVCARWKCTLDTAKEGAWSGNVDMCTPGDCPDGRKDGLLTANTYRFLAGLDPVTIDPEKARVDQACAVMLKANNQLSHTPPNTWTCYTADGYDGSSHSNIATAPSVYAVHLYMFDGGSNNQGTLGHRRWIIAPSLETIGIGSTDTFSCMYVLHSVSDNGHDYVPWPPAGPVPIDAIAGMNGTGSLDSIGWSIQSNSIALSAASEVKVLENGQPVSVKVYSLGGGYGSNYAISFKPDGWVTQAGRTYEVSVTGTSIHYTVEPVSCK